MLKNDRVTFSSQQGKASQSWQEIPRAANTRNRVPFVDLRRQVSALEKELHDVVWATVQSGQYVLGDTVQQFERKFAEYCGVNHCVGVSSGTAALHLALVASGIGANDEVITAPNTFIATVEAILYTGARPVFVDVDPITGNIDAERIPSVVTERTKAVIPVHLYGQPADMASILEVANSYNLLVIEDACQAHGARYKGRRVGGLGHAGCFSFYPSKNLGACGEAGAVVTNDSDLAERIRVLRDHGQSAKYLHRMIGYNYRMDALQAAILQVKLKHLDEWNDLRRKHAQTYAWLLADLPIGLPASIPSVESVFHLYVIRSRGRDDLQEWLAKNGIGTGIHYPIPVHLQDACKSLGYTRGDFPCTERLAEEILSLPMFPELEEWEIERVATLIQEFFSKFSSSGFRLSTEAGDDVPK